MKLWTDIVDYIRVEYAFMVLRRPNGALRVRRLLAAMKPWKLTARHLELIRRVNGTRMVSGRLWQFTVQGIPKSGRSAPSGVVGFFRHYAVLAATIEEALEMAAAVEPERDWAELRLDQLHGGQVTGPLLAGVVSASGPAWYGSM